MSQNFINLAKRYTLFIASLFILAFGCALSIRANLGCTPISSPPYVLSLIPGTRFSFGVYTIFMHIIFIAVQIALAGKNFNKIQLLQIPVGLIFGLFTDITMWLTQGLQFGENSIVYFFIRFFQLFCGSTIVALGVSLEIKCNVLLLAGEGFTSSIAKAFKIDFGKVKILTDSSLTAIAILFSFLFFGCWRFDIIGIGTLFSAIYVGVAAHFFSIHTKFIDRYFDIKNYNIPNKKLSADQNLPVVITIARMCGSGGHEVGKIVSEKLNIKFWDQDIISHTARQLGVSPEYVEKNEQHVSNAKLLEYAITDQGLPREMQPTKSNDIFTEESRIICQAATESCVIIGRLADYVLKDRPCCLNVFIRSDDDFAVEKITKRLKMNPNDARQKIKEINRSRANHYFKYTGLHWTSPNHYDLIINTAKVGIQAAADIICNTVNSLLPINTNQSNNLHV